MDNRLTALLGIGLLSLGMHLQAQDYDDIYYDGSESNKKTEKVITTPVRSSRVSTTTISTTPRKYRIPAIPSSSLVHVDVHCLWYKQKDFHLHQELKFHRFQV